LALTKEPEFFPRQTFRHENLGNILSLSCRPIHLDGIFSPAKARTIHFRIGKLRIENIYRRSSGTDGAALVNRLSLSDLQERNPQFHRNCGCIKPHLKKSSGKTGFEASAKMKFGL
jgi:hypothetical protein